jgi:hypothetical protein
MATTELKKKANRVKVFKMTLREASLEELVLFRRLVDDDLEDYAEKVHEALVGHQIVPTRHHSHGGKE